jgi:hypothetical protein
MDTHRFARKGKAFTSTRLANECEKLGTPVWSKASMTAEKPVTSETVELARVTKPRKPRYQQPNKRAAFGIKSRVRETDHTGGLPWAAAIIGAEERDDDKAYVEQDGCGA